MSAAGQPEPRSFGVEEEYLILDRITGEPQDRAAALLWSDAELERRADREFFCSQIETATPICTTGAEADQSLADFRARAGEAAAAQGTRIVGTGLPPVGGEVAGTITPKPRYREIAEMLRHAAAHQYVSGTHVHVEVPDRDAGVAAIAAISRWSPALLALTANSPIWDGEPTGFASWRHMLMLSWPLAGFPHGFTTGDEYATGVERLVSAGVIIDAGMLTWVARLSEQYPTVELRIADAQLDHTQAVSFALLVRGIVERSLSEWSAGQPVTWPARADMIDGALWMAARDGLSGTLIDPATAETLPARDLVRRMAAYAAPGLERTGDTARVTEYLEHRLAVGSPAQEQLDRFASAGIAGLMELYAG